MSYPNETHYSEHFSRAELQCHCGCETPDHIATNLQNLAVHLETFRALVGGPVHVNDAYRCPTENHRVGGVPDSQHLQGKAADLDVGAHTVDQFAVIASKVPAFDKGGIGRYPSQHFLHVDYRNGPSRWDG